jgi:hypothetical protein
MMTMMSSPTSCIYCRSELLDKHFDSSPVESWIELTKVVMYERAVTLVISKLPLKEERE